MTYLGRDVIGQDPDNINLLRGALNSLTVNDLQEFIDGGCIIGDSVQTVRGAVHDPMRDTALYVLLQEVGDQEKTVGNFEMARQVIIPHVEDCLYQAQKMEQAMQAFAM